MKTLFRFFCAAILLALVGCNDEVFVDRPSTAPETDVNLSGGPANKGVAYSSQGLTGIDISLSSICPIYVIDSDSKIILQTEGTDVGLEAGMPCTVDVYGRSLALTLDFMRPDYLVVASTENHSTEPFRATVTFRYRGRDRKLSIEIAPGQLFTIDYVGLEDSSVEPVVTVGTEKMPSLTVDNNGEQPVKVPVRPFGGELCTVTVSMDADTAKMLDFETAPEFDVLSADADGTLCYTGRYAKFRPGLQLIPLFWGEAQRTFVVPAHTKVRFDITHTVVRLDYKLQFRGSLPSGEYLEGVAAVHVVDRVDYTIDYEVIQ